MKMQKKDLVLLAVLLAKRDEKTKTSNKTKKLKQCVELFAVGEQILTVSLDLNSSLTSPLPLQSALNNKVVTKIYCCRSIYAREVHMRLNQKKVLPKNELFK